MLDPRIYRAGLIAVAMAVIVVAFSFGNQRGPVTTSIPPDAFNGQNAYANMKGLAHRYPQREPGSVGDDALAGDVATALRKDGFSVSQSVRRGHTARGTVPLETVTGSRIGETGGTIAIVTHRDSLHSPATADLSGTAVMLELARVLSGETLHRSLVLASTSGSAGAVGASQIARSLPQPVDAVIALGDLAGSHVSQPVIVPWSNGEAVAPPLLRNTLAAALRSQGSLRPGGTSLGGQLARLAFPLTTTEQGPFGARGYPSVLLSLSSERPPAPEEPIAGSSQISALGRAVLESVNALDSGPSTGVASPYLLYDGKVIPAWAIRLLVLALMLPVLMATIDGLARARRRGHRISPWIVWVLMATVPFLLAFGISRGAQLLGELSAPPGPVRGGDVALDGTGLAVLALVAVAVVLGLVLWRPLTRAAVGRGALAAAPNEGAGAAVLVVLCAATLVIWAGNPFAALLLALALHLWMWLLDPDRRLPRAGRLLLLAAGAAPIVLVLIYYASVLDLGPLGLVWNAILLLAGGHVSVLVALEWSVVLGCIASVVSIVLRTPRAERPLPEAATPVTVRGPVGYAGPGSLGGTESALRR